MFRESVLYSVADQEFLIVRVEAMSVEAAFQNKMCINLKKSRNSSTGCVCAWMVGLGACRWHPLDPSEILFMYFLLSGNSEFLVFQTEIYI